MTPEPRPTPEEIAEFLRQAILDADHDTDLLPCVPALTGRTALVVDFQRQMPGYSTRATRVRIRIEEVPAPPAGAGILT